MMGHFLLVRIFFDWAGRDAWIGILIAFVPGILIFIAVAKLNEKFYGTTIIEKFNEWFGVWLGRIFSLPLILYFFILSIITFYGLVSFIQSIFLVETPVWAIAVVFGIAVFYAVHLGIEVITRVSEWILVWILAAGFILFFSLLQFKDHSQLLPMLENGIDPIIPVIILNFAVFGELLVMLMINVKKEQKKSISYVKIYIITLIVNLFVFLGIAIGPVAIFGEDLLKKMNYPNQSTVKMMSLGFIERLDAYGLTLAITGSFIRLGILHYATSLAVSQWLKMKNYRLINWILGVVLIISSLLMFNNFKEFLSFLKYYYPFGAIFAGLLIILWIVSAFSKK